MSKDLNSIYTNFICSTLLKNDIEINIYDPMVKKSKILDDIKVALMEDAEKIGDIKKFLLKVQVFSNPYDSLIDTNIISICTEWDEFKDLDWKEIYSKTNLPRIIVDGRNILNKDKLEEIGFKTFFIGKS